MNGRKEGKKEQMILDRWDKMIEGKKSLLFTRGSSSISLVIYLPTWAEKEHINSLINSQALEVLALQGPVTIFFLGDWFHQESKWIEGEQYTSL